MKKIIIDILLLILAIIGIITIVGASVFMESEDKTDEHICNECGGNLVYKQAVPHLFKTSIVYECEKCGKVYEVSVN